MEGLHMTTRRTLLIGSAAAAIAPATALPAIAKTDPIFAAIEKHREAHAAVVSAGDACSAPGLSYDERCDLEEISGDHCTESADAYAEMLSVNPTTVAGCAALLRCVEAYELIFDSEGLFQNWNDDISSAGRNLLSRVAAALEGNA